MVSRIEGVGPMQYGTKGLLGPNFTDIEEKYDLTEAQDGFGEEGEDAHASDEEGKGLLGDLLSGDDEEDGDASDEEEESDEQSDDDAGRMFDDSSEAY
jgi:hypothetical protein